MMNKMYFVFLAMLFGSVWFSIVGLPLDTILRLKIYVDVRNVGDGAFDSVVLIDRLKYNL